MLSLQPNVICYNNSLGCLWRGLMERLYYVKDGSGGFKECPKPAPQVFKNVRNLARRVGFMVRGAASRMDKEQFLSKYAGARRARYEAAAKVCESRPLKRSDGFTGVFIKAELYNASAKKNPCTRLIQPRRPEYLYELGRYTKPIEKSVYKAIDKLFGHHAVLKCDNPVQRGITISRHWHDFADPVFLGFDASRFDQHVSREALEFEHTVYLNAYRGDTYLQKLLSWQLRNTGYGRTKEGFVKFTTDGVRMSGDPNTALGNVIIMSLLCYKFLNELGIKYRYINDGDDCGVFVERRDMHLVQTLPEHHLQYGFEMDVEPPAYVIEQVEFCQCRPVNTGNGYVMIRNVHKALAHDTIHIDKPWAGLHQLRSSIGVCGGALNRDIPVVGALYQSMLGVQDRVVDRLIDERSGDFYNCTGSNKCTIPPVNEAICRASFYLAFGILPDQQVAIEQDLRGSGYCNSKILIIANNPKTVKFSYNELDTNHG